MDEYIDALNDASVGLADSSMSASAAPPPAPRKLPAARNKQSNFSVFEDNVICKSWLEIGCDAITNTGQRKESFWFRVVNRYNTKCSSYPKRTKKSIMSRWDTIKAEILKDEPKWLKRKMDTPQNSASNEQRSAFNLNLDPDEDPPANSSGKRPMGRDAAKAAKKKASSATSEYVSKMHDLSILKIELFKDVEVERKARLDEMVALEKVKVEEAREQRNKMLELEIKG